MHQTCPAKYNLRINQGWTARRRSAALGFGAAVHNGLAAWHRGHGLAAAITAISESWPAEAPIDDYRTLNKAIEVMTQYTKVYPEESFKIVGMPDNPIVEQSFTLETGMYLSVCRACGIEHSRDYPGHICDMCGSPLEPIEYGGIFDGLVEANGMAYIFEHKTTSQLGDYYFDQFKPNNQITGYVWAAGKLTGRRVGGAIINAIGVYKAGATRFRRSITTRSASDIDEWLANVRAVANEIDFHRRTGFWPMRTAACTIYGACEFRGVHTLSTEREREILLEQDYVKSEWDFERRDG